MRAKHIIATFITLFICLSGAFGQIKVTSLPKTSRGAWGDLLIKDDSIGTPGSTKVIRINDFLHYYDSLMFTGSGNVGFVPLAKKGGRVYLPVGDTITSTNGNAYIYMNGDSLILRSVGNGTFNLMPGYTSFSGTTGYYQNRSSTKTTIHDGTKITLDAPTVLVNNGDSLNAKGPVQFANGSPAPGKFLASVDIKGNSVWDSIPPADTSTIHGYGVVGQLAYYNTYKTLASSPNLFWDRPNHRLGIATNIPSVTLDVNGIGHIGDSLQIGDYGAIKSTSTIPFLFVPHYFGQPNSQVYFQIQDRLGDIRMRVNEGSDLIMGPGSGLDAFGNPANLYINGGQFTVYAEYALLNQSSNVGVWSNSNDGSIQFGSQVGSQGDVYFVTDNNSERMRLKGITGNIGIGTSTPNGRLNVQGSGTTSSSTNFLTTNSSSIPGLFSRDDGRQGIGTTLLDAGLTIKNVAGDALAFDFQDHTGSSILFAYDVGVFNSNGRWQIGAFNNNPDAQLVINGATDNNSTYILDCQNHSTATQFQLRSDGLAQFGKIVEIGSFSSPDPSAILSISSTTQGFLWPVMTSTQRLAIPSPAEGLEVYDLTTHNPWYFNGTIWVSH